MGKNRHGIEMFRNVVDDTASLSASVAAVAANAANSIASDVVGGSIGGVGVPSAYGKQDFYDSASLRYRVHTFQLTLLLLQCGQTFAVQAAVRTVLPPLAHHISIHIILRPSLTRCQNRPTVEGMIEKRRLRWLFGVMRVQ
ncbi:hypothetical protein HELRODRAFT_181460 [Helobdella robusta]|uniref:Uncharacterized protein n=1 Tax=Helobdella robusta TaxID=6412 RepID=T1FH10_HELRO|nr:hypothetical protein HELRODRAFT_181460 [Helobdella robusta]ESN92412.1 hypothetical protein HELRODRAFT_181460 [Helobdella robusta]